MYPCYFAIVCVGHFFLFGAAVGANNNFMTIRHEPLLSRERAEPLGAERPLLAGE